MKPEILLVIVGLVANLPLLSSGFFFGWITPMLPKLLSGEDGLKLSSDQGSWAVSLLSIGCVVGQLLVPLAVDRIGRKRLLLITMIPTLIACLILSFANTVELLYAGRFIGGIGAGAPFPITPMFTGEISQDKIRGGIGTLLHNMFNVGMMLAMCIGPWVSQLTFTMICVVPSLVFLVIFPWFPETPYFLVMKGRTKDAEASLSWYRQSTSVKEELLNIQNNVNHQQAKKEGLRNIVKSKITRKSLFICSGIILFQQATGIAPMLAYTTVVVRKSNYPISDNVLLVVMSIAKTGASMLAFFPVDRLGRRPTLFITQCVIALTLLGLAIFFHLQNLQVDVSTVTWLPPILIIFYMIGFVIGYGTIPYILMSELFPMNTKAAASVFLSIFGSAMAVITSKVFTVTGDAFGIYFVFYSYSICTILSLFFTYFCVPETNQRSLQDILTGLSGSNNAMLYARVRTN